MTTSGAIDCAAFANCKIYRVQFPVGQSAQAYLLAERDRRAGPLGALLRAAGWVGGCAQSRTIVPIASECPTIVPIVSEADASPGEVGGSGALGVAVALLLPQATGTVARQSCPATRTLERHLVARQPPQATETVALHSRQATGTVARRSSDSPVAIKLDDLQVTTNATEITITTEWRRYRIRGLERNTIPGVMRVNLLVYNVRREALEFLQADNLLDRILDDFEARRLRNLRHRG